MSINLLVAFLLSMFAVIWIHPRLVKIALLKNIVDNEDEDHYYYDRKLIRYKQQHKSNKNK